MDKIFADSALARLISNSDISFSRKLLEKQLQPASIDLRLGKVYTLKPSKTPVNLWDEPQYNEVPAQGGVYNLQPRKLYFFESMENLKVSDKVDEIYIAPRSSFGRALVNIIGLTDETYFRIQTPFKGRIFCSLYSNSFPLSVNKGERIVQLISIKRVDGVTRTRRLHLSKFLKPKDSVTANISNGIKDSELFDELDSEGLILGPNGCVKGITAEKIDYSTGDTASIVEYFGGQMQAVYGSVLLNTGYAPFIDPGFSGTVFGVVSGSPFPKTARIGDVLLDLREYELTGRVRKLYGSKNLGSHYKKSR